MPAKYTIDTCAIDDFLMRDRYYDHEVFVSAWNHVNEMCEKMEIISHIEVFKEIIKGGIPDVVSWAKKNKKIFLDYQIPTEVDLIKEIGKKFPMFLYQKKDNPVHADPWLVAQAMSLGLTIITSEKATGDQRVPYVAEKFGVHAVSIVNYFKERGIKI